MINKVSKTIIALVIIISVAGEFAYMAGRIVGQCD
jgi:hypothetical protein